MIAEQEVDFARGFTEALIEYGLGRLYGFTDPDLAQRILTQAKTATTPFSLSFTDQFSPRLSKGNNS